MLVLGWYMIPHDVEMNAIKFHQVTSYRLEAAKCFQANFINGIQGHTEARRLVCKCHRQHILFVLALDLYLDEAKSLFYFSLYNSITKLISTLSFHILVSQPLLMTAQTQSQAAQYKCCSKMSDTRKCSSEELVIAVPGDCTGH